jgi:hypothetical protein
MTQDDNHNNDHDQLHDNIDYNNNDHDHKHYVINDNLYVSSTFKMWCIHNLRYENAQMKTPPIAPCGGYSTYTSFSYSEARLVLLLASSAEITINVSAKATLRAALSVPSTPDFALP